MNEIRAGFIYFEDGVDTQLVGIATFENGMCMKALYNEPLLDMKIKQRFGDIYMVPEYLSKSLAGMSETFWTNFLAKTQTFVRFSEIKDMPIKEFNQACQPMLPYLKMLEEGKQNQDNDTKYNS
jgi:hypothetical protein